MRRLAFNAGSPKNVKAIAAVSAGVVAFMAIGYLALISPQRSRASELSAEISSTQQQLIAAQLASRVKPETPRVDDLFRLTKAMPDSTDMPSILLELSRVASDTGIEFESITPGAVVPGSGFQMVPIQLLFHGNYYQLSDFLFRLRNLVASRDGRLDVSGRLYSIDGVDFSQSGTGSGLEAKLTAKAFVYASAAAAPATATPVPTTTPTTSGGTG